MRWFESSGCFGGPSQSPETTFGRPCFQGTQMKLESSGCSGRFCLLKRSFHGSASKFVPAISLVLCVALLGNLTNEFGLLNPKLAMRTLRRRGIRSAPMSPRWASPRCCRQPGARSVGRGIYRSGLTTSPRSMKAWYKRPRGISASPIRISRFPARALPWKFTGFTTARSHGTRHSGAAGAGAGERGWIRMK